MTFETKTLNPAPDVMAPDGSEVRILCRVAGGSMAHFSLPPGTISKPVAHRTVEEVWFVVAGRGRMWRRLGAREETVDLAPGVSITIPVGTRFQFRCDGAEPLAAVGVTMPPWPGLDEAYAVEGAWAATA
jgi:mannose-6-phosphate isomerase-like protein (cupin superfamily)